MKYISLIILSLFLFQCGNTDSASTDKKADTTASTQQAAPVKTTSSPYPSIGAEQMQYLWNNCDYVDYVFYHTSFSMNQAEQGAIRATLAGVSTQVADIDANCQPVGRVFFMVDGQNIEEADIFFGGNCFYYIFYKDKQYAYANKMTEQGINFYKNVFTQVQTQPQAQ